jgi:hypothetical protein
MWTWLHGRAYLWEPDPDRATAHFWFKDADDAVMFKLMWG